MLEYNPYANRVVRNPTSDLQTFGHFASLGTGVITMPLSMMNSGLLFGIFTTIFVGLLMTYCMNILIISARKLYHRARIPSLDYCEVAFIAFQSGPKGTQKLAYFAGIVVDFFLVISMIGVCCVYHVFAAANIKQVFDHYCKELKIRFYILILFPILIFWSQIRTLKYLAPFSIGANILILIGLCISYYYITTELPNINSRPAIAQLHQFPIFFGSIIYNLVGIQFVMPLENNMTNPNHLIGCCGILNIAMALEIVLYTITGFFGYLKYGDGTEGVLTLNLPSAEPLAQSVKLLLATATLMTFGLQFYVPINIIWRRTKHLFPNTEIIAETLIRAVLLSICVLIVIVLPNIEPLVSIFGAVAFSFLALIIPPIIHLVTFCNEPTHSCTLCFIIISDCFLIIFGLVGCFTGTYASILDIINNYL